MSRNKEKTSNLDIETQVDIQTAFPKLTDFHRMAGLTMERPEFYAIVRGEDALPQSVQAVELGWVNILQVREMSNKELVANAQRYLTQGPLEGDDELRGQLQVLVGRMMFGRP